MSAHFASGYFRQDLDFVLPVFYGVPASGFRLFKLLAPCVIGGIMHIFADGLVLYIARDCRILDTATSLLLAGRARRTLGDPHPHGESAIEHPS